MNFRLQSITEDHEKDVKLREDLSKDAGPQWLYRRISGAWYEEERLSDELDKIAARLETQRATRVEYMASTSSELDSVGRSTSALVSKDI